MAGVGGWESVIPMQEHGLGWSWVKDGDQGAVDLGRASDIRLARAARLGNGGRGWEFRQTPMMFRLEMKAGGW